MNVVDSVLGRQPVRSDAATRHRTQVQFANQKGFIGFKAKSYITHTHLNNKSKSVTENIIPKHFQFYY